MGRFSHFPCGNGCPRAHGPPNTLNYENAGLQSPDDPVRTLNNFVTLNLTGSVNTEGWGLLPVHRWAVWQCCKARPLRGELATPRLPLACGQRRGRMARDPAAALACGQGSGRVGPACGRIRPPGRSWIEPWSL